MRPVSVAMVGFGTFSDSVVVDFDGADVFALVGPTGSGKSTVIDAICFALYGSLPRYADRRVVGAAVHAQAAEARVALTFDLGDQRYVAVRVVRRDQHGKATTKEARLERADGEVLAGTAKEMDRAVPSLIGLDFDQFTRAVVLPQGEFARFLHDKPAARQDLLVQLLGLDVYERMMQRARSLAATEAAGRARDQERLDALAHATPEVIRALTHHAEACAAAAESWRAAKESAAVVLADVDAAERSMATSTARLAVLASVQPPTDFATIADRLAEVDADRVAADAAAVAAEVAVAEVDARIAEAGDRAALTRARQLHTDLAAAQAELVPRQVASVEADAESARLATVADAAEEHAEALRTANAAEVVRRHLVVGAPCPVCEQTVTATPSGPAPEAWQAARQAAVAAREAATTAAKLAVRRGVSVRGGHPAVARAGRGSDRPTGGRGDHPDARGARCTRGAASRAGGCGPTRTGCGAGRGGSCGAGESGGAGGTRGVSSGPRPVRGRRAHATDRDREPRDGLGGARGLGDPRVGSGGRVRACR